MAVSFIFSARVAAPVTPYSLQYQYDFWWNEVLGQKVIASNKIFSFDWLVEIGNQSNIKKQII